MTARLTPAITLAFVGPEEAEAVREMMLAAFQEYEAVLSVPSSAMWETEEDVASHISLGGAVLAQADAETAGSGRFEWREDHVYIGRLSAPAAFRLRGFGGAGFRHGPIVVAAPEQDSTSRVSEATITLKRRRVVPHSRRV